jgi:hypothetical protein
MATQMVSFDDFEALDDEEEREVEDEGEAVGHLLINGEQLPLRPGENTIGKSMTATVRLQPPLVDGDALSTVSRVHATLIMFPTGGESYGYLVDKESTNGTFVFVDGGWQKVAIGGVVLQPHVHARLRFGMVETEVRLAGEEEEGEEEQEAAEGGTQVRAKGVGYSVERRGA